MKQSNNNLKVKDIEKFFKKLEKKTGKEPHFKGKGGGTVKIEFD